MNDAQLKQLAEQHGFFGVDVWWAQNLPRFRGLLEMAQTAETLRKQQRLCCYILDQADLTTGCRNPAVYEIWGGQGPDDFSDSCAAHLEAMLSDERQFHIFRIEQVKNENHPA